MALVVDEWKNYHNENGGGATIAQVTEDGDCLTYGGQRLIVTAGDRVARTSRPDEYVLVQDFDVWTEGEPTKPPNDDPTPRGGGHKQAVDVTELEADGTFNPSKFNAKDVNTYLSRDDISDEEYVRVREAEVAGKNRKSALPE